MKYFKVVRVDEKGRLVSAVAQGRAKRTYRVGRWTKANEKMLEVGYGICIFDNYHGARNFIIFQLERDKDVKIFECEIQNPIQKLPRRSKLFTRHFYLVCKFYKDYHYFGGSWPVSTCMAERIKLIKEVT